MFFTIKKDGTNTQYFLWDLVFAPMGLKCCILGLISLTFGLICPTWSPNCPTFTGVILFWAQFVLPYIGHLSYPTLGGKGNQTPRGFQKYFLLPCLWVPRKRRCHRHCSLHSGCPHTLRHTDLSELVSGDSQSHTGSYTVLHMKRQKDGFGSSTRTRTVRFFHRLARLATIADWMEWLI